MFEYRRAPLQGDEIRLLKLLPGADNGDFSCVLTRYSIRNAPDYYALSYTWDLSTEKPGTGSYNDGVGSYSSTGAQSYDYPSYDGLRTRSSRGQLAESFPRFGPFQVRPNLMGALRRFSRRYPQAYLWVDAICINQEDIRERNSQVRQMYQIYESASKVVVWLGEQADDSDEAFEFMRLVSAKADEPDVHNWLMRTVTERSHDREWRAIICLLQRKWWTRVWVIQEVVVAREVEMVCGNSAVSWKHAARFELLLSKIWTSVVDILASIGQNLYSDQDFVVSKNAACVLQELRESKSGKRESNSLLDLLDHTQACQASDPRDNLYGILGIANDGKALVPRVDYGLSPKRIFTELAINYFNHYNRLDIISLASSRNLDDGFSSWHPNLYAASLGATRLNPRVLEFVDKEIDYHADSGLNARASVSSGAETLRCAGICIDEVDGIGFCSWSDSDEARRGVQTRYRTSRYGNSRGIFDAVWRTVTGNMQYRDGKYSRAPTVFKQCFLGKCREADAILASHRGLRLDHDLYRFTTWYQDIRDFQFAGRNLRDYLLAADASGYDRFLQDESNSLAFQGSLERVENHRRLLATKTGYFGMGPKDMRCYDKICVLLGYYVPVVLRRCGPGQYRLIGECYVHGIMYGEAIDQLKRGEVELRNFDIV